MAGNSESAAACMAGQGLQGITRTGYKMKKRLIAGMITLVLVPALINCSTKFDEDRYIIIDVHFTLQPVTETNRLWAVVFLAPNWTNELFRFSSGTNRIIIPLFKAINVGNFVGYMAIVYDSTGTGVLTAQRSIGFDNITPSNTLSPVAFLEIKTMFINVDLDSVNAGPCPFP